MLGISGLTIKFFQLCSIRKCWKSIESLKNKKAMYTWMQWTWLSGFKKENVSLSLLPLLNVYLTSYIKKAW